MDRDPTAGDWHADDDLDESDLSDVPRVFIHQNCGGSTQLSAATVRRYLRDPFRLLGVGNAAWCAACQQNCRAADCVWAETGQNVGEYFQQLIGAAYLERPRAWWARFFLMYGTLGSVIVLVVAVAYWQGTHDFAGALSLAGWVLLSVTAVIAMGFALTVLRYRRCAANLFRQRQTAHRP